MIDDFAAVVDIERGGSWQDIVLAVDDFENLAGDSLPGWENIRELKLSAAERLTPARSGSEPSRIAGKPWQGPNPEFRNLRWVTR